MGQSARASEPGRPAVDYRPRPSPGETAVLALALESQDAVVILDDGLARHQAKRMGLRLTGTLGLLIDAKRAGYIEAVSPHLDALQSLRFRLDPNTRLAVLRLAGEA